MSSSGIAAQFTLMNGPSARSLASCSARATSSLPVPLSPRMRTRAGVGATSLICSRMAWMAAESPTMTRRPRSRSRWTLNSLASERTRKALRTASTTRSREHGFSRKSKAPSRVASTAVAMVPWPEIMITGHCVSRARRRRRVSRPSMPGKRTSRITRSMRSRSASASASSPFSASATSKPSERSTMPKVRRMFRSSSTIRMRGVILPPRSPPRGSEMVTVVPAPGADCRSMRPP